MAVILLSPEQLSTSGFRALVNDKTFTSHLMALNIDEVHLLCSWGNQFCTSFKNIGHIRVCFPHTPVIIALTATICTCPQMTSVCRFLGLHEGQYHLIRCSNACYNMCWLFCTSCSGLYTYRFPELNWFSTPDPLDESSSFAR